MPNSDQRKFDTQSARSSWQGCLRIADDQPERRLRLVWQGWPPHFLARNGLALFILTFNIAFLVIISVVTVSKLPPGWMLRFDILWRVAAVGALFGGVSLFVSRQWIRMIGSQLGYWRSFDWDAESSTFRAHFSGSFLGGRRRLEVPFSAIRGFSAMLPAERHGRLPIEIQFHQRTGTGSINSEPLRLEIDHLDQRSEALDFLFRIARVIGLKSYVVQEKTLRTLKIKLVHSESRNNTAAGADELSEGKLLPIPAVDDQARYDLDVVSAGVPQQQINVPPFAMSDLQGQVELTQITNWEPGRLIHILRPGLPNLVWRVLGMIGGLAGTIFGGFILAPALPYPGWSTCLVSAITGAVIALVVGAWVFREREVILDWSNGQVWWRESRRERTLTFEEVTGCVLQGTMVTKTENDSSSTTYRTDVWLETVYRRVLIIGTDTSSSDPDKPYRALAPFTAALAESLHVPWHWDEYRSRAGRFMQFFRGGR